jgi:hypothetical protein
MARASLPGTRIRSRGGAWSDVRAARFVVGSSPRAHIAIDGAPRHLRIEIGDGGSIVRAIGGAVSVAGVPVLVAPVVEGTIDAGGVMLEIERGAPWEVDDLSIAGVDARSPLRRLAASVLAGAVADRAPLVIEAEPGAGATTAARAVHALRGGPLVEIDAAADIDVVEPRLFGAAMGRLGLGATGGAFTEARGGTLVLDHVDAIDPALHTRLIAALDRADDVAVIATARDLDVSDLAEPLYERLAQRRAWLPPLAAAPEDLHALAVRFAADADPDAELPRDLPRILGARRWRGNLRELRAFMARLVRD